MGESDTELAELMVAELHRMENLSICYQAPHSRPSRIKKGISDAPNLRTLKLDTKDPTIIKSNIPCLSPRFPLKFLESLHITLYKYSSVSQFFRPTLKHLFLDNFSGASVVKFLHALAEMPLLETVTANNLFGTYSSVTPELPTVKLSFLRKLCMLGNEALSSIQVLDQLLFPAFTLLEIQGLAREDDTLSIRLSAAILSKAAGYGLSSTAMPLHTLHVRTTPYPYNRDPDPTVYIWTDDPSFYAADKPQAPPIPSTQPFCSYCPDSIYDARDALEDLCSAAPDLLGSVRTLIVSHDRAGTPWYEARVPPRDWSGSFMCLVGLESLYLDCIVWDGLGTLHTTLAGASDAAQLPFLRLRVLYISRICFRYGYSEPHDSADFIDTLQYMLENRKNAGITLAKLVIWNALDFGYEDMAMLGAYVDEVERDERELAVTNAEP